MLRNSENFTAVASLAGMDSATKSVGVPQVPLGSAGLVVSAQGLGCMGMSSFYGPPKPDAEMIELIRSAIDLGVTFLDTSDVYGPHTNEVLVGKVRFLSPPVRLTKIRNSSNLREKWGVCGVQVARNGAVEFTSGGFWERNWGGTQDD